ncbi:MAG: hypothetical protein IJ877_06465 [Candidatus Gastranaerophilales bacterium]|nr:hypothetical protein [Candidatus Gastranaerophilales bacterium]
MEHIVDLTSNFSKTPTIQEVKEYIQSLIDKNEVFDTLNPDWKIDIRGGRRIKNHIAYSSKAKTLNKAQKNRHNKYIMGIVELINNSSYTNKPKANDKPIEKPNIDMYHYFETNVKIGDKQYRVILNTEQYKNENLSKPQIVHLYDVIEVK